MRQAVIDIGTNTCNLIIFEIEDSKKSIIAKYKEATHLGNNGINSGFICKIAFERGIDVLEHFRQITDSYGVSKIYAFATSALRNASNRDIFTRTVFDKTAILINIIDGDTEAELIYQGVKNALKLEAEYQLILDIGGGSNEFIIANSKGIIWKKSFELGMTRILNKFCPSNPITNQQIIDIENYFNNNLNELFDAIKKYPCHTLIGSSGSFNTYCSVLCNISGTEKYPRSNILDIVLFKSLYKDLLVANIEERLAMKGMDAIRVEMIHLAAILVNLIIEKCNIKKLIQSEYALKEGIMFTIAS